MDENSHADTESALQLERGRAYEMTYRRRKARLTVLAGLQLGLVSVWLVVVFVRPVFRVAASAIVALSACATAIAYGRAREQFTTNLALWSHRLPEGVEEGAFAASDTALFAAIVAFPAVVLASIALALLAPDGASVAWWSIEASDAGVLPDDAGPYSDASGELGSAASTDAGASVRDVGIEPQDLGGVSTETLGLPINIAAVLADANDGLRTQLHLPELLTTGQDAPRRRCRPPHVQSEQGLRYGVCAARAREATYSRTRRQLYLASCEAGNSVSCVRAGKEQAAVGDDPIESFVRACLWRNGYGCTLLGRVLRRTEQVELALLVFERAAELGDPFGLAALAHYFDAGGSQPSLPLAARLSQRACDVEPRQTHWTASETVALCRQAARMWRDLREYRLQLIAYVRACETGGDSASCNDGLDLIHDRNLGASEAQIAALRRGN